MGKQERLKQLDAVIKSINSDSKYKSNSGETLLAKLSDRPMNVETISSGSMVLDQILGGGIAKGRVIEFYGQESSGKTSIALTAVGNVQKVGGTAVFIDVENALDPRYAAKLGVNIPELAVAQPDSAEQAINLLYDVVDSGVVDIVVLDSVAAMVPRAVLEGNAEDQTIGLLARIMSQNLSKIAQVAARTKTTVIFINQLRDQIGGFSPFGTPTVTSGGKALKFYASQRVEIKKGKPVKSEEKGEKDKAIGTEIRFKIVKNKVAPPFGVGTSVLTFNRGINVPAEMVEVGVAYGVIEKPTVRKWIEAETGDIFATTKAEALEALEKDAELMARLTEAVKVAINADLFGEATEERIEEEANDTEEADSVDTGGEVEDDLDLDEAGPEDDLDEDDEDEDN